MHDPRVTPARSDLAAAHLAAVVPAARYVEGTLRCVARGVVPLRAAPDAAARRVSELLYGERVTVYDEAGGWAWVQGQTDLYVGYAPAEALTAATGADTHRVRARHTPRFAAADLKSTVIDLLPLGSIVRVVETSGSWHRLDRGGYVFAAHCAPLDAPLEPDPIAVAERFVGTPYLWGGRSFLGIDCSGLVQLALHACGHVCPRDSDQQSAVVGDAIVPPTAPMPFDALAQAELRRGDLVFFPGHVGLLLGGGLLLHATGFSLDVRVEPLVDVAARAGGVSAVRRLA